jgi:nicotinate-nucleotide pyrophosphorylase (carboxylating)
MNPILLDQLLQQALIEDIGHGDVTTNAIFSASDRLKGKFIVKKSGRIAGLDVVSKAFQLLDPNVQFAPLVSEGADLEEGSTVAVVEGSAHAILSGERVALNLFQRMSGIATETREICKLVADLPVRIVDTRKTLPGLRMLDKYAVRVGGGSNHRHGLYDAVMIKDNHIAGAGSITSAVDKVRQYVGHMVKIEVEAETMSQVEEALAAKVDVIMLDNMTIEEMKEAVKRIGGKALSEASGGITPDNVREVALTGVDMISLGWLTHSVKALDISLEIETSGEWK